MHSEETHTLDEAQLLEERRSSLFCTSAGRGVDSPGCGWVGFSGVLLIFSTVLATLDAVGQDALHNAEVGGAEDLRPQLVWSSLMWTPRCLELLIARCKRLDVPTSSPRLRPVH